MSNQVAQLQQKLPPYKGQKRMLEKRQDTYDIIREILHGHKKNIQYYDGICMDFYGKNTPDIAEALYKFAKDNMPYQQEPVLTQTIKTPSAILAERYDFGSDCKHYASWIVGVGEALRRRGLPIKCFYRFASYKPNRRAPGHVFAVFVENGKEYWVDPVPEINGFNSRLLKPVYKTDKMPPMSKNGSSIGSLYEISGIQALDNAQIVAGYDPTMIIGRAHWLDDMARLRSRPQHIQRQAPVRHRTGMQYHPAHAMQQHRMPFHLRQQPVYDHMGKIKIKLPKIKIKAPFIRIQPGKFIKKVGEAPARNAYLALLKLNTFDLAVQIHNKTAKNPAAWKKIADFWSKNGGDTNKLHTAVDQGVKFYNKLHPAHKVSGYDNDVTYGDYYVPNFGTDGTMGVAAVAGAALIAAAAPIIKAISGILKSLGISNKPAEDGASDADSKAAADHNSATDDSGDGNPDIQDNGSVDHGNGVTTKVTKDKSGKQTISYDVKDPITPGDTDDSSGSSKTVTKTKTKTTTKTSSSDDDSDSDDSGGGSDAGGGSGGGVLDTVKNFVSGHKVPIALTAAGAIGLAFSIGHKGKKGSMVGPIVGLASGALLVYGGVKLVSSI